jgi:large subunit ribosomal protein L20
MPRAVSNVPRLKRKKQIMKAARGAFGARSKLWRPAKETVERGWKYAYRDRKNKKRDFRRLWIQRINAGARELGLTYSRLMSGIKKAGIAIDREVLDDLAAREPAAFDALVKHLASSKEEHRRSGLLESLGVTQSLVVAAAFRGSRTPLRLLQRSCSTARSRTDSGRYCIRCRSAAYLILREIHPPWIVSVTSTQPNEATPRASQMGKPRFALAAIDIELDTSRLRLLQWRNVGRERFAATQNVSSRMRRTE